MLTPRLFVCMHAVHDQHSARAALGQQSGLLRVAQLFLLLKQQLYMRRLVLMLTCYPGVACTHDVCVCGVCSVCSACRVCSYYHGDLPSSVDGATALCHTPAAARVQVRCSFGDLRYC